VRAPATKLVVQRTRKAKLSEPSDEELRLMKWWSAKRVPEIARRQHETAGCNMLRSDAQKNSAYVRFLMGKLMKTLPTAGGLKLLQIVRAFNDTSDIEAFSESIKELVDEFAVKVNLTHAPECTVRAAPAPRGRAAVSRAAPVEAALPSIDLDCDLGAPADDMSWPSVSCGVAPRHASHSHGDGCCGGSSSMAGKRKRTETLNGAHPEDDDEGASCPVCKDEPREDDRWVKCDGCGSWYHQICVLFNEIAHGKSVRFFCRTPGCRKRGSRQLNRRQRKPCYPTSPSIESSALADEMMQMVQPVARSDRDVVIKMVANVESVREIKGSRACRKTLERVRNKTICAFQHTLIGSDLLFLIMFVEEVVGPDGVGRVEIKKVDNNGFYEEERHKEALEVEKAIVEAYLSRSAAAGFASARIHIDGLKRSLFLSAPASPFLSSTSSLANCMELLREACAARIVHGFEEERTDQGSDTVVRAQLVAAGTAPRAVAPERDVDVACPVAQTAHDWLQVQKQHGYMFEDLQFAKFSSMMLVYHLIKGWRKEFSAPVRQAAADYDSDESTDVAPPPSRCQAPARDSFVGVEEAVPAHYYQYSGAAPEQPMMLTTAGNYPESRGQMSDGAGLANGMPFRADNLPEGDAERSHNSMTLNMDLLPHDVRMMLEAPVEPIRQTAGYDAREVQVPPPPPASPPLRQESFTGLHSGENDSFWSDTLFQQEADRAAVQDEAPYWDCFFNTL